MRIKLLSAIMLLFVGSSVAFAQSTEITYQGKLTDNGTAASGNYDFEFRLFDVSSGSTALAVLQKSSVVVTAGVFAVQLDFGANRFTGLPRFLEIAVRPAGNPNPFNVLTPRQPVTATPYAVRSLNSAAADSLSTVCVGCVTSAQVGGVSGSLVTGTIPVASVPAGSGNYVQNTSSQQASSNFNISGNGTAGGTLAANAVNTATQYNIGGERVLSAPGLNSTNIFAGLGAGQANTNGTDNSFVGRDAGVSNTTGEMNSFFGMRAGQANTQGYQNSFFGWDAGHSNQTGNQNSFFGMFSGLNNTTGQLNVSMGYNSGVSNSVESLNTFIGSYSNGAPGISNATAVGYQAKVTQSNSLVLGSINGVNDATVSTNVGIGTTTPTERLHVVGNGLITGNLTVNGTLNAALPTGSANYVQNTTGQQASSNFNISGNGTAGGTLSANAVNAGTQYNIGGSRVLSVPGTNNLFAGAGAGQNNSTGSENSFFGQKAGQSNTNGLENSFFGYRAGESTNAGGANSFFGRSAGQRNTDSNGNSFFGFVAGVNNTTGNRNTFIGESSGSSNTVESNNTFVGSHAEGEHDITNATAIGSNAKVTQSNSLVLGSINGINGATAGTKVGIGTTAPAAFLQILPTPVHTGNANFFQGAVAMLNSANNNGGSSPAPPETVLVLAREGVLNEAYANFARFDLKRYENVSTASRSQLDLRLSHNALFGENNDTPVIMSLQSGGNVGIGTTAPVGKLQVVTANDTDPLVVAAWDARHFVIGGAASSGGIGMSYDQTNNVGYIQALSPNVAFRNLVLQSGGNVGIGTGSPTAKLQVAAGDAAISTQGRGLILRATNGPNCYRLTVDNAGALATALVPCP